MGLLRIVHALEAMQKCKPESIDERTFFYACTQDKCLIGKYDRGATFSGNGKVYKICMLFMQMTGFDKFVIEKITSIKGYYSNIAKSIYLAKS
jgi:hypothetical protein